MRIYILVLFMLLSTSLMYSQKTPPLKFIKEITVPAGTINLKSFWKGKKTKIFVPKDAIFYEVVKELTKADSIYEFSQQTFYIYQNLISSEMELMKVLGEEDPLDLSDPKDHTEIKNRLALISSLIAGKSIPESGLEIYEVDSFRIFMCGYLRLQNGLVVNLAFSGDLFTNGWSMEVQEQRGTRGNGGLYWFISRRKPKKTELK